ncbi:DNA helicase UvrD [Candidatus Woesearchaeota archaeon]|nr:DNA helicase UvrD [Candidatus Woesearchaeota archaeon]
MEIIADLHIHSKHSQATGKELDLTNLEKWAKVKGVDLLGTGDFTHPKWIEEIKGKLSEDGNGILKTAYGFPFILQTEISLIYTDMGKGRKIHNIVYAPDLDAASKITSYLLTKGRVDYDGRPIFGIPCDEFVESLKAIDSRIEIVPAHIWTPWFSLFGANSGYDKIKDCFKDMTKHIFALETGLSSDPAMNWRLSALDKYTLISNSDLHSYWPWRIGREANVFELKELRFDSVIKAIKTKAGFKETIEVDPAFGKYHWTGHRNCDINLSPKEALKHHNVCPKCGKNLTVGVEQRVEELADREEGYVLKEGVGFKRMIPLSDILSIVLKKAVATKTVWAEYNKLVSSGRSEYDVMRKVSFEGLRKLTDEKTAEAIIKNREGRITVKPGYDGVYGEPLLSEAEIEEKEKFKPKQRGLGEFF